MADLLAELRAVFCEALEQPTTQERAAYLEEACRGKPELRARVEALLLAHRDAGGFLDEPSRALDDTAVEERAAPELLGTAIGPYTLLEAIGEGGFGIVFRAEQRSPVGRQVALKVLKPGMDSRQVVARFEAERQALALMDHPNIARVFDGGTSPAGRPYFVMELVRGLPITEFCKEHPGALRERLRLFIDVCRAVQHAHLKGVIHRDLKPSNVLVALQDGRPVVKVIDFGIAKALGQRLTDKTLSTGLAQVLGTPLYMSPEQAGLAGGDIDTRADIYALGVILYELLTGTTPFPRELLSGLSEDEMRRVIREEEPPTPSRRLRTTRASPTPPASSLQELDWIVMKALEKDRERRYESAGALAADVERYLRDEPVAAGPPSAWYRFRKFARRRRGALATAAVLTGALILVGGGFWWSERRQAALAATEEAQQEALDQEVNRATDEAEGLTGLAKWPEAQAAVERAVKLLAAVGRTQVPERLQELQKDVAMAQELDGVARWSDEFAVSHQQLDAAYARAFRTGGIDVEALTTDEAARRIRARSIRLELLRALESWSRARRRAGDRAIAPWQPLLEVVIAADSDAYRNRLRTLLTGRDSKGLEAMAATADVHRLPAVTLYLLGTGLAELGATEQAISLLRAAQRQYPDSPWLSEALGRLCYLARPPHYADAVRYLTAAAAARPRSAYVADCLGLALWRNGSAAEAVAEFSRALELKPDLLDAQLGRALAYQRLGEWDRARAEFARLAAAEPGSAKDWYNRGLAYGNLGQWDRARAAYSQAIEREARFAMAWAARGEACGHLGRWQESLADCSRAIELDAGLASAWHDRGQAYEHLGKWDLALAGYSKAIELDPRFAVAWAYRGGAYSQLGQAERALADCSQAIELDPRLAGAWSNRGAAYLQVGQCEKALADLSRAVELDPGLAIAWTNRGGVHLNLGKTEQALADLSRAVELDPGLVAGWCNRGLAYGTLGKWDRALADYSKAIELDPQDAAACYSRGTVYGKLGRWDRAVLDYSKAVELAPKEKTYWSALGSAHYRADDCKAAVAALDKATQLGKGGDPLDWLYLAMARWKLGDKDQARQWYARAANRTEKDGPNNADLKPLRAEAEGLLNTK
jgi:serine/threonine-protein kinase